MMSDDEDKVLRSVALQNMQSILQARHRAEQELIETKEALEDEKRILELLNKTGRALASNLDLRSVVQAVTDAATKVSGAQFGAFFRLAPGSGAEGMALYTMSGAPLDAFEQRALATATSELAPKFGGDGGVVRIGDLQREGPPAMRSYLAVTVMSRTGAPLGGLVFGHCERDLFTERAERLVVGIAAQASVAIDNAQLYEDAKMAAEDRARLLEAERAARGEIERISLVKDEFLATLSHELRTPLNGILGWSSILLASDHDASLRRRGLETIARNARAQAQLIEDLLDMNRIVSGKLRLDVQRIEFGRVVEAALDSVRPSMEAKSIALHATIDPNVGLTSGDPNRLQQVVWNLLANAVKFTPKGGKIDVVLRRVNSHLEFSVEDSGIGVSAVFLPHLFERFRQADSSTTRKYGGLGLGLSIVKQLVELHGGSVAAASGGQDRGSTFVVKLPLRDAREPHETEGAPIERHAPFLGGDVSLAGINVLVVDDEVDAREFVELVLVACSATVVTAASAHEALALVKARRPDVIVSDIGMPERDGYQFMRDVRQLAPDAASRIPAIALTAFARSEDRTRVMLAGYQMHVAKPIEPKELVATIKSLAGSGQR